MTIGKTPVSPEPVKKELVVTALERGLRLLMALRYDKGRTLSDVARETGLDKATASRLLRSLGRYAFVSRGADDLFTLGPALAVLTATGMAEHTITAIVGPTLEKLAKETGETATFFVPQGDRRLCVAAFTGGHAVGHAMRVGDVLPTDRGAGGKVMRIYASGRPAGYQSEVHFSLGERDPELAAVASPVFDSKGNLLGALSLSGTSTRFSAVGYPELIQKKVRTAIAEIDAIFLPRIR